MKYQNGSKSYNDLSSRKHNKTGVKMKLIGEQEIANRCGVGYAFVNTNMCRPELNAYRVTDAKDKTGILEQDFEIVKTLLMNLYYNKRPGRDTISERNLAILLGVSYQTIHNYGCKPTLNKFRVPGWGNGIRREDLNEYMTEFKRLYKDVYKRMGRIPKSSTNEKETEHDAVCTAYGIPRA